MQLLLRGVARRRRRRRLRLDVGRPAAIVPEVDLGGREDGASVRRLGAQTSVEKAPALGSVVVPGPKRALGCSE